jgi:hypothetical protein
MADPGTRPTPARLPARLRHHEPMDERKRHAALLLLRESRWQQVEQQLAQYQAAARQRGSGHADVLQLLGTLHQSREAAQKVEELISTVEQQQA